MRPERRGTAGGAAGSAGGTDTIGFDFLGGDFALDKLPMSLFLTPVDWTTLFFTSEDGAVAADFPLRV